MNTLLGRVPRPHSTLLGLSLWQRPRLQLLLDSLATVVPGEDTVVPGEDTVVPGEDTIVPGEDTVVPGGDMVVPGEDTVVPGEDTVVLGAVTEKQLKLPTIERV